jgi:mannan endo-1,4-beta-mannosidase
MRLLSLIILLFAATNLLSQDLPADKHATKETVHFYHNLKSLMQRGVMFGHQDDLAYGYGWKYEMAGVI